MPDQSHAKVAILLCTYNGQEFLSDQLDSISAQSYSCWKVWASDDGSTDGTRKILSSYVSEWGEDRLSVLSGPRKDATANFLALTCNAHINADYYAYSDQDDIWQPDKLQRAIAWLQELPTEVPALYCSRTLLVDAGNREIGFSPLFTKKPAFANALVQNIGGGNTMVFNNPARELIISAGAEIPLVVHDWWAYLAVSGCGGSVHYDPQPSLRYRQHGNNLIGMNADLHARIRRLVSYFSGQFKEFNDRNISSLDLIKNKLTPENQRVLEAFALARRSWLVPRLTYLKSSGVYRQTLLSNLSLIAAAIFGKL